MRSHLPITHAQPLGVAWVLRQAAILAVLSLTAVHVAGVIYLASVERRLSRAASASAREAAQPAATVHTIRGRALGKLQQEEFDTRLVTVAVHCNGCFVDGLTRLRPGDEILVTLSTPGQALLPPTMGRLAPWLAAEEVVSEAKMVVP